MHEGSLNGADSTGAERPADLQEVSGRIKWFDVAKGYGFVVPDDGSPDILLHVTVLRRSGFVTAFEGSRVVCEAHQCEKGMQVFRVIAMDESTAIVSPVRSPLRAQVAPTSGYEIAIVKWFNRVKGFGFLSRGEGTDDIFLHMETVRHGGMADLQPGESVLVRYGKGEKGLQATEVRPLAAPQRQAAE